MRARAAGVADYGVAAPDRPRSRRTALKVRYRLTPWWVKVVVIFIASRVITTAIILSFAARQAANAWTGPSPNYFDFAKIWDGHWYYIIAVAGMNAHALSPT